MLFFDFESLMCPTNEQRKCTDCRYDCKCSMSHTLRTHAHKPIIYSFILLSMNGDLLLEESGCDLNGQAHIKFLNRLLELEDEIMTHAEQNIPAPRLSAKERRALIDKQDGLCSYCETSLDDSDEPHCLDHIHYDGSGIFLDYKSNYLSLNLS